MLGLRGYIHSYPWQLQPIIRYALRVTPVPSELRRALDPGDGAQIRALRRYEADLMEVIQEQRDLEPEVDRMFAEVFGETVPTD